MPVPPSHRERLESDLCGRERWLVALRRGIAVLEDEARAHEVILSLGRDPGVLRLVDELHDEPALCERMTGEPRAYLDARGVTLPDGAIVTITGGPKAPGIEVRLAAPSVLHGVTWSPGEGFHLLAPDGEGPVTSPLEGT